MQPSLCSKRYNAYAHTRPFECQRSKVAWESQLPRSWREQVVEPVEFEVFREYEMAAQRITGHDEDGLACYCAHSVTITELRSDDDEDYYQVVAYAEHLSAWRLRDGRWLIHRTIIVDETAPEDARSFFSFGDAMPR